MPKYRATNSSHAQNAPSQLLEIEAGSLDEAVGILIHLRYKANRGADIRHKVRPKVPDIRPQSVYICSGDTQIEHWSVQDVV